MDCQSKEEKNVFEHLS